ncbi:bifunctional diaminohydroxyphosphoribosylaminopyrimidine deaminase/5-amino-6-(5-phosphoribosylamino)uracil reductase RibD [Euzebya tangerina]|uniref:bifunctional diaminohydroxyphosphoribosylaminopyrimidine deaminase/5-amino-6-(5-phosphoribosylamino)uracil reductase RibD n=1 Tax=Euzebya tangerina TaxID=591198 RepID=UPI00196ABE0E|nr:bifunctional diaminohydroxyphosphoribosylaminopyrimidine deaminase/5-amino-6-(5-phosphoribosylamino)uracil reductase RibD [Euzebya tangerina]
MSEQRTAGDAALDRAMMDRAFDLGERGRGRTSPNPFVGCVIAQGEQIVGEGWTQPPPGPHAEIVALEQAGAAARGAAVYVTLEPCAHIGRTPPCTDALLAAGVARVVIALTDPNPVAAGGVATLVDAGVAVDQDVAVERATRQHEIFLHTVRTARPFVIAKTASSLDGYVADHAGRSKWITGPQARAAGHRLRAEVDAILVGSETALADDPSLTVRDIGGGRTWDGPQPLRVVLDRRGRVKEARLRMQADDGAAPLVSDATRPEDVLQELWALGIGSVLVEGGPTIVSAFITAGLVDRYEVHLGGVILGEGLPAVPGRFTLDQAPRMIVAASTVWGTDVVLTAYPRR